MTKTNFNFNQTFSQPTSSDRNLQDFFRQHRLLTILIMVGLVAIVVILIISIFTSNSTPKQEVENPPYITFEHEDVLENLVQEELGQEILFNIQLILLQNIEYSSAPADNSNNKDFIVSFNNNSVSSTTVIDIPYSNLYTINIEVSDGRQYLIRILVNNEYQNEYAVATLQQINQSNTRSYIITFTSHPASYYTTLGTNKADNAINSTTIFDHITGEPLNPLPEAATNWLNSLKLTDPQTIHATLPSIR